MNHKPLQYQRHIQPAILYKLVPSAEGCFVHAISCHLRRHKKHIVKAGLKNSVRHHHSFPVHLHKSKHKRHILHIVIRIIQNTLALKQKKIQNLSKLRIIMKLACKGFKQGVFLTEEYAYRFQKSLVGPCAFFIRKSAAP